MRLPTRVGLAAVAACLTGAGAANAATLCVGAPAGCSGTPEPSITAALAAAASGAGGDTIQIAGSHTYTESGLSYAGSNPIDIVGVGSSPPVITAAAPEAQLLNIQNNNSTISNVAFLLPPGSIGTALTTRGPTATGITVTGPAVADGAVGINLVANNATVSNASIQLPTSNTVRTTAVLAGSNDQIVRDSTLAASQGIFHSSGNGITVSRVQVVAPIDVELDSGAGNVVEDSVLVNNGKNGLSPYGVKVLGSGVGALVRNDTIVNDNSIPGYGVVAFDGQATVRDSIVLGFSEDLVDSDPGASLSTDYNDYAKTQTFSSAAPITAGPHDLNDVTPGFVNAPGGDYHLAATSPLIDKGDPAVAVAGESSTDVFGADRFVAGLGGCTYVRDIGAAEYQRPPVPSATASAGATAGTPVTFTGSVPCNPGANSPVTFAWSFDDGAGATGASVQHPFATAGTHHATVTASTSSGAAASTTVSVDVAGPSSPGQPRPTPIGKPAIHGLALSPAVFATRARKHHKAGTTVSYRIDQAATVTFTVQRLRAGRLAAHRRCVAPSRHNRHARKCTRALSVATFTAAAQAGVNSFHFSGVLGRRRLGPGNYLLVATPRGSSGSITARFKVLG